MAGPFTVGQAVQTPFGKGVVRAIHNNGRVLVDVKQRTLLLAENDISALESRVRRSASRPVPQDPPGPSSDGSPTAAAPEIDLHGLTVAEALARAEHALNAALLADAKELRLIHGRSGGRIRAALHHWLGQIASIRGFRLDPRNAGATIVDL